MRYLALLVFAAALYAQIYGGGGGGTGGGSVTSVTVAGTANQITATGTCTGTTTVSCTLSLPTPLTLPGTINNITLTPPATGSTLTIANGKTVTESNTLTYSGTDGSAVAFGTGGTVTYTIASGQTAMPVIAVAANSCSAAATTATATGTLTTDGAEVTFASDPTGLTGYGGGTSGGITIAAWPTAGLMNFKLCNQTASSITPGALNINWRVVR